MSVGASIGITLFPNDGSSYDDLLINADLAMYAAKKRGRNTFAFFTLEIGEQARERVTIESDLKEVVRAHQLAVQYQPKVSCRDGRICGVEALVRWNHPTKGNIPPDKFIAIAEETGLIADIDRFVLERATREIGELIKTGSNISLAVNVSVVGIEDPGFSDEVINILNQTGFPPSRLELEITETAAMRDPAVVGRRIASLRQIGIRFAIDDFGAGYSNLAALARLPFDAVKLDRSLIRDIRQDPEKQSIIRIALGLAQELGFETVAEGVETIEDFDFVAQEGATMAQGFLFSPAVSLDELAAMLQPLRLAEMARRSYGTRDVPLPRKTEKRLQAPDRQEPTVAGRNGVAKSGA
jgi:EAL domain-containing protein (putative c-di-GMP-specific phosphodiesterase class I)